MACRWWWGLAAGGPAQWTGADSHGWELHCVSSGSPRWGRCSRSACSPAAGSAGGSRSSWARRWEMSNSPHSSCLSPRRHVAPGGCHSCSASSSCWTSSGCHMSTPPPCASRRNWTDSIKQCSAFPSPVHMVKKARPPCRLRHRSTMGARQRLIARVQGWNSTLKWLPTPGLQWSGHPLFAFACSTNDMSQTGKQYANMPRSHKQNEKSTLVLRGTTGICNHIQSTQPTLIPFFLSLSREPNSNTERRRTADSNSFSCSQWLLQTWTEYFDFNKSKWATQPCFIKGSSDWGKYPFFALLCSFPQENRCYVLYSIVMTTNFTRHIPYNWWYFFTICMTSNSRKGHF